MTKFRANAADAHHENGPADRQDKVAIQPQFLAHKLLLQHAGVVMDRVCVSVFGSRHGKIIFMEISQLAELFKQKYAQQQRQTIRKLLAERRPSSRPFGQQLAVISRLMDKYADEEAQSAALDVVLQSGVYERLENHADEPDYTDRLVRALLEWYKSDFFTWINRPPCPCGNADQTKIQPLPPVGPYKKEHFDGRADIIEQYRCAECSQTIEFPRYNNPKTLLSFRKGRCGEWNNCFILILCALGLKARYIWNAEDHVWCEYYSQYLKRWVHLDSCENQFDNPTLYCDGWGKKMSYVFAVSATYIADVSPKYIKKGQLPRNRLGEYELADTLAYINLSKWIGMDDDDLLATLADFINDYKSRRGSQRPTPSGPLVPRQSGAPEWRRSRGEDGLRKQE
ncbi:hypothetical protein KL925_003106 [Ogataea polymorpha]|nr:hypothetical protein KL925_003106 [Ogataea polymorpha]